MLFQQLLVLAVAVSHVLAQNQACDGEVSTCQQCRSSTELFADCEWCMSSGICNGYYDPLAASCSGGWVGTSISAVRSTCPPPSTTPAPAPAPTPAPCSTGCPGNWINDNTCDSSCNNALCNFDGNDCNFVLSIKHDCPRAARMYVFGISRSTRVYVANPWMTVQPGAQQSLALTGDSFYLYAETLSVLPSGVRPQRSIRWGGTDFNTTVDGSVYGFQLVTPNLSRLTASRTHLRTLLCAPYNTTPSFFDCADGCPDSFVGDMFCDTACRTPNCLNDRGDCPTTTIATTAAIANISTTRTPATPSPTPMPPTPAPLCSFGCQPSMVQNGACDTACNNAACNFDGTDCNCERASPQCTSWQRGNQQCDAACNNAACLFDKGDCDCLNGGCTAAMMGNGICDAACNKPACGNDGADCRCTNRGCQMQRVADDVCDAVCNVPECQMDGGDCACLNASGGACMAVMRADRICQAACNIPECLFDAGACATPPPTPAPPIAAPVPVPLVIECVGVGGSRFIRSCASESLCSSVACPADRTVALATTTTLELDLLRLQCAETRAGCAASISTPPLRTGDNLRVCRRSADGQVRPTDASLTGSSLVADTCEQSLGALLFAGRVRLFSQQGQVAQLSSLCDLRNVVIDVGERAGIIGTACAMLAESAPGSPVHSAALDPRKLAVLPIAHTAYVQLVDNLLKRVTGLDDEVKATANWIREIDRVIALRKHASAADAAQLQEMRALRQTLIVATNTIVERIGAAQKEIEASVAAARSSILSSVAELGNDLGPRLNRNFDAIKAVAKSTEAVHEDVLANRAALIALRADVGDVAARIASLETDVDEFVARSAKANGAGWDFDADGRASAEEWLQMAFDAGLLNPVGDQLFKVFRSAALPNRRREVGATLPVGASVTCARFTAVAAAKLEEPEFGRLYTWAVGANVADVADLCRKVDRNRRGSVRADDIVAAINTFALLDDSKSMGALMPEAAMGSAWRTLLDSAQGKLTEHLDNGKFKWAGAGVEKLMRRGVALSEAAETVVAPASEAYQSCSTSLETVKSYAKIGGVLGPKGAAVGAVIGVARKAIDGTLGKCVAAAKETFDSVVTALKPLAPAVKKVGAAIAGAVKGVAGVVSGAAKSVFKFFSRRRSSAAADMHPMMAHLGAFLNATHRERLERRSTAVEQSTLQLIATLSERLERREALTTTMTPLLAGAVLNTSATALLLKPISLTLASDSALADELRQTFADGETYARIVGQARELATLRTTATEAAIDNDAVRRDAERQASGAALLSASDISGNIFDTEANTERAAAQLRQLHGVQVARMQTVMLQALDAMAAMMRQFSYWSLTEQRWFNALQPSPTVDDIIKIQSEMLQARLQQLVVLGSVSPEKIQVQLKFTRATHPALFESLESSGRGVITLSMPAKTPYARVQILDVRGTVPLRYPCDASGAWLIDNKALAEGVLVTVTKGGSSEFTNSTGARWLFAHPPVSSTVAHSRKCEPLSAGTSTAAASGDTLWFQTDFVTYSPYGTWTIALPSFDANVAKGLGDRVVLSFTLQRTLRAGAPVNGVTDGLFESDVTVAATSVTPLCEPCTNAPVQDVVVGSASTSTTTGNPGTVSETDTGVDTVASVGRDRGLASPSSSTAAIAGGAVGAACVVLALIGVAVYFARRSRSGQAESADAHTPASTPSGREMVSARDETAMLRMKLEAMSGKPPAVIEEWCKGLAREHVFSTDDLAELDAAAFEQLCAKEWCTVGLTAQLKKLRNGNETN
jgi:hypothetical protein